jgi:hypothetical protein
MLASSSSSAPAKQFASLIGNGLSIAYNPRLQTDELTQGMLDRLSELGGDSAAKALSEFAQGLNAVQKLNFETLLSPLDHVARALPDLAAAAPLVPEFKQTFLQTAEALAAIHRIGIATVLELISERAYGEGGGQLDPVIKRTCRAINELPTQKGIAVGTLNYDGLIHAGFLDIPNVADLVPGYVPIVQHEIVPGLMLGGRSLRRTANFRNARIQILNMHGSLSWLWNLTSRDAVKFEMQALRDITYWKHLREGTAQRVPVVVLTDQKESVTQDWPFSLAYGAFENHLSWSSHWLIAGYGFADEPLNAVFRDAVATRFRFGRSTAVLVIDAGRDPDDWRSHIATVTGLTVESIRVNMDGLPEAVDSPDWNDWKDSP